MQDKKVGNDLGSKLELEPLDKKDAKFEDFDDVLEVVGSEGKYQKLLLYVMLSPLTAIMPLFVMNTIFLVSVPDHWCHVPGRPNDTDLETWKNLTLPWEDGPDGNPRISQCKMYQDEFRNATKACESWEYDRSNYKSTIPTEFDWVCENSHYGADVFSVGGFGNVVGTIIFGQLADKFGRKPFFFTTVYIYIVFSFVSLFVPQYFVPFLVLKFLAGTAFPFIFSSPAMIAAELSSKEYRAWIYSVVWMVWVIGNSALPLIAYLIGSWFEFGLATTIPAALYLVYYKVLDESPRWLLSVGRVEEALQIMMKIAKTNGKSISEDDLRSALSQVAKKEAKAKKKGNIGIWTLFTRRKLAWNTIMLCLAWTANGLTYYAVTLNTTSMSGNEFLNYFLLGLIELPGGWLAGVMVEKTGRRWTQAAFFLMCAAALLVASTVVSDPNSSWVILICVLIVKFGVSLTSLVVYLQGTEIFPTQLRSTGSGLASTVNSILGTCGPYIVLLGQYYAAGPYMILAAICLMGTISASCLPETLHQSLPETAEDANNFGQNQKFWSFLPEDSKYQKQQSDKEKQREQMK